MPKMPNDRFSSNTHLKPDSIPGAVSVNWKTTIHLIDSASSTLIAFPKRDVLCMTLTSIEF